MAFRKEIVNLLLCGLGNGLGSAAGDGSASPWTMVGAGSSAAWVAQEHAPLAPGGFNDRVSCEILGPEVLGGGLGQFSLSTASRKDMAHSLFGDAPKLFDVLPSRTGNARKGKEPAHFGAQFGGRQHFAGPLRRTNGSTLGPGSRWNSGGVQREAAGASTQGSTRGATGSVRRMQRQGEAIPALDEAGAWLQLFQGSLPSYCLDHVTCHTQTRRKLEGRMLILYVSMSRLLV